MKVVTPIFLLAAAACAQDLSGVPPCGRQCVENMFAKAQELGCSADDFACLCENADFGHGLHDCTVEACPEGQLEPVQSAAAAMCPDGGDGSSPSSSQASDGDDGATPTGSDAAPTATGTDGTAAPTGTDAEPTATGGEDSTETGDAAASTPYTTKPVVSTVTSDGEAKETTVGSTTLYTQAAAGSETGTAAEPTETGGNGNGNGNGNNDNNDDNSGDGNGNGSGDNNSGNGNGSGGNNNNNDDSGDGSGDATGTDSGSQPTSTGAAAALATHAGSMVGAVGLAALFVM
jgi:hypothetical protein